MARLLRLAKHHGVQPDHIDFSIQVHSLELSTNLEDKIQVVISRGSKAWPGAVVSSISKDGHWQFLWNSPIQITSSMFPSKKGPRKYDAKAAKIVFKRITKNSAKTFGEIELDLADFCEVEHNHRLQRPLHKCSDKYAQVDFTITSLISQRDVSPSMIDDESMAISPEQSQIENETFSSQSMAAAQSASIKQGSGASIPSKKIEEQPNANDGSKGSQQSVQLLVALKDDTISRLRKKVEELELINKSSMNVVNRVNELEEQLSSKTKAYDQLTLNLLTMEKLLAEANTKVEELGKGNDSDDEHVKDELPEALPNPGIILPASSNGEIQKLLQEKDQLLVEIANLKLDMASAEESYRKEMGDLKSELNQARNEKNDASTLLQKIQDSSKEHELMEALELEKVSCESLKGIVRALQEKSTQQENTLLLLQESSGKEISEMKERLLQLENENDVVHQEVKLLTSENGRLKSNLEQSELAMKQLLSENDELKRSVLAEAEKLFQAKSDFQANLDVLTSRSKADTDRALAEVNQRFLLKEEELSTQIQKSDAVINTLRQDIVIFKQKISEAEGSVNFNSSSEKQMELIQSVFASCHQCESVVHRLIDLQSSSSVPKDLLISIEKLISEQSSFEMDRLNAFLKQEETIQSLTEKIDRQNNMISISERSRYEAMEGFQARLSALTRSHNSHFESLKSRITEYQQLLNSSNNDLQKIDDLKTQMSDLRKQIVDDMQHFVQALEVASSSIEKLRHDFSELLELCSRDVPSSVNISTVSETNYNASIVIAHLEANNESLKQLLSIEMERSTTSWNRLKHTTNSLQAKVAILETKLMEVSNERQRLQCEVDESRIQNDQSHSVIQALQQKVDLMEKSAQSDQAKLNKVMVKYEKLRVERDQIVRDLIQQKLDYHDLYNHLAHKLSFSTRFEHEKADDSSPLSLWLHDFDLKQDRCKSDLERLRCELNDYLSVCLMRLASGNIELQNLVHLLQEERFSSKNYQLRIQQLEQYQAESSKLIDLNESERKRLMHAIKDVECDAAELSKRLIEQEHLLSIHFPTKELERYRTIDLLNACFEQQQTRDCHLNNMVSFCSHEVRQLRQNLEQQRISNQSHLNDLVQRFTALQEEKIDSEKQSSNVIVQLESQFQNMKEELRNSQQLATDCIASMKVQAQLDMNQIAEFQSKFQKLNDEKDAQEKQASDLVIQLESQIQNMKKELINSQQLAADRITSMQAQTQNDMNRIAELQSKLQKLNDEKDAQDNQCRDLVMQLKNQIQSLEEVRTETERVATGRIASLQAQAQLDMNQIADFQSKLQRLTDERDAQLQEKCSTIADYESRSRIQADTCITKSQNYENRISGMENELREKEFALKKAQDDLTNQTEKLLQHEYAIKELRMALELKEESTKKLQNDLMRLNDMVSQHEKEIDKRINLQAESERSYLETNQKYEMLLQQHEELQRSKVDQDRLLTHYKEQEIDMKSSKSEQLSKLSEARSTIELLESQIRSLRNNDNEELMETKQKLSVLEQELSSTQQNLQRQIQELKSVNQSSKDELHKAHSMISVLEEELQHWKHQRSEQHHESQATDQTRIADKNPEAGPADHLAFRSENEDRWRQLISERDKEIERLRMSLEDIDRLNKHLEERLVNTNVRMSQMQDEENQLEEQIKTLEAVLDDVVRKKAMEVKKK